MFMDICRKITGLEKGDGFTLIHTNSCDIKIIFITDEIVRVRASFDKELAEESYIFMTTAWEDAGQRPHLHPPLRRRGH